MRGAAPPGGFAREVKEWSTTRGIKRNGNWVNPPAAEEEMPLDRLIPSIHAGEDWLFSAYGKRGERSESDLKAERTQKWLEHRGLSGPNKSGEDGGVEGREERLRVDRFGGRVPTDYHRQERGWSEGGAGGGSGPAAAAPQRTVLSPPPDRAYPEGHERPPQKATKRGRPDRLPPSSRNW